MNRTLKTLLKVLVMVILVGYALYLYDESNAVVLQASAIGVFLVGMSHLTRRILLDQMDLQRIAAEAVKDNNVSAALVFLGVLWFLVQIMQISMSVLK